MIVNYEEVTDGTMYSLPKKKTSLEKFIFFI